MTSNAHLGTVDATLLATDSEALELLFMYATDATEPETAAAAVKRISAWGHNMHFLPEGISIEHDDEYRLQLRVGRWSRVTNDAREKMEAALATINKMAQYNLAIKQDTASDIIFLYTDEPWEATASLTMDPNGSGASIVYVEKTYAGGKVATEVFARPSFNEAWDIFTNIQEFISEM